jgi:hypothetical protein
MRHVGLLGAALGAALLMAAGCSKRSAPAADDFGCTPAELHRGEKLTVRLPQQHGEDLAVVDPDGRLYYVAVYTGGAGKRPGLDPAIDPVAFRRMDQLETTSAEAEGAPQDGSGGNARKAVFTKSGPYQILLGDNLGTQYAIVQGQCEVRYTDTEKPKPTGSGAG